jgi:hypothetical protein
VCAFCPQGTAEDQSVFKAQFSKAIFEKKTENDKNSGPQLWRSESSETDT